MPLPAPPLTTIPPALASLPSTISTTTKSLLTELHTLALTEPPYISTDAQPHTAALDRFVALDPDKCALLYLLIRSTGATCVVEAGTSFGVSTIWCALGVGGNVAAQQGEGADQERRKKKARVIATENEASKASRAREYWGRAPEGEVGRWIELREGDLRETLKGGIEEGEVDLLLLDIWTPLALPTLQIVAPKMRVGAMVVIDNITAAAKGYHDLEEYMRDDKNGFRWTVAPYPGGLGIAVYTKH